ncbi:DUF1376 domain-containing protein [Kaistia terrae]|uniref:DUF1376 domain-containing protein n=1 Tax=Kaistia terrae TaxID=537017 RepID=A0ABW0PRQ8_9HYPH|nr:DUF1376 domain-containing protein [Kaistia terrae]MCX5580220.1 DUF1376 domain-containing protein [Kaistia terrae]
MTASPRMPISVVEELAVASDLTAEEYGAYMLLRMHQWQYGLLPTDNDRLSRIAHVAADEWPQVASVIRPRFGPNWRHEDTHRARQKSAATHERLSNAGKKGGSSKGTAKPIASPATAQAASQGPSPASAGLGPELSHTSSEASLVGKAGDKPPFPAIADPKAARAWLLERSVFPGDLDELQRLLVAGKLTPAILASSAP